jgi:hypothetical protein
VPDYEVLLKPVVFGLSLPEDGNIAVRVLPCSGEFLIFSALSLGLLAAHRRGPAAFERATNAASKPCLINIQFAKNRTIAQPSRRQEQGLRRPSGGLLVGWRQERRLVTRGLIGHPRHPQKFRSTDFQRARGACGSQGPPADKTPSVENGWFCAGQRVGLLAEFQVGSSGCNGASRSFNSLAGEHVVTNTAGTVNSAITITGSCTAPDPNTGRGTIALTISGGTPFANTTLNFVYYAASASGSLLGMLLGEENAIAANQPILGGLAQPVGGGFASCIAPAACILAGSGTTDGTMTARAVAFLVRGTGTAVTTSTGTIAGVLDENFGGTITTAGTWPYSSYAGDTNDIGTIRGTGPTIHYIGDGSFMDESVSVNHGRCHRPKHDYRRESGRAVYHWRIDWLQRRRRDTGRPIRGGSRDSLDRSARSVFRNLGRKRQRRVRCRLRGHWQLHKVFHYWTRHGNRQLYQWRKQHCSRHLW